MKKYIITLLFCTLFCHPGIAQGLKSVSILGDSYSTFEGYVQPDTNFVWVWSGYFQIEKGIYEQILSQPEQVITGTVKELAEKYNTEILIMTGFLDGINESLKGYENPIDTMEEDTEVKIEIDPEKLYYNMVEAKATWLYELPQWDAILTPEKRKELYKSQKASGTVRKAKKIFPNDPCPCGSGKKYKKCCGKNA